MKDTCTCTYHVLTMPKVSGLLVGIKDTSKVRNRQGAISRNVLLLLILIPILILILILVKYFIPP